MVFNNFYWKIVFRILLLVAVLFLFSFLVVNGFYLRSAYVGVAVIGLCVELILFVNRFAKNVNLFLTSLLQRDFSIHFKEDTRESQFNSLYRSLNQITQLFKEVSSEREVQHLYLETLVNQVDVGIISFDNEEKIHLANRSFLKLVNKVGLSSLEQLKKSEPSLSRIIESLKPHEASMFKLHRDGKVFNLALYLSEFKLDNRYFKLITLQDITHELNASEMEAWQKLIRVLTHEIMNSISPIISLSGTLHNIVANEQKVSESNWNTLKQGLEAIKDRSGSLHQFTQKYRELTQVPIPVFKRQNIKNLIEGVVNLLRSDIVKNNIKLDCFTESDDIVLDAGLLEQVLINIVKNSIEALEGIEKPMIKIDGFKKDNRFHLLITDNGQGIDEDIREKIFVPFFTTKKTGSGIGLALARQIILLHKGELTAEENPSGGTVIRIVL